MKIAFLHTAQVHVETFDALVKVLAPDAVCDHHVAPELLARAQANGLSDVAQDTTVLLSELAQADAVLCTCSTLGPLADSLAKTLQNVIRIDRPLMEEACRAGANIMVVICLESTRNATLDLLADCAKLIGQDITPQLVLCDTAWPYFEAGDLNGFATEITARIRAAIDDNAAPDCIVLAQASMRVASAQLEEFGIPILSSPTLATQRLLAVAATTSEISTS